MSKIRVWTDGRWSDEISGLDKVYLIKTAIQSQLYLISYEDAVEALEGFEINHYRVTDFLDKDGDYYNEDGIVNQKKEESFLNYLNKKIPLSQVQSFITPLAVLKVMKTKEPSLAAIYEKIISATKAPIPTPKGYCLNIKFEDE